MKKILKSIERALLISIKPKYVAQIVIGNKRVELRRTRPNIGCGEIVLIYESSPTMALVGYGVVEKVISSSPWSLWPRVRKLAGISKAEFDGYFRGAEKAYGIEFEKIDFFNKPIGLVKLREKLGGFHPPQIYRYLSKENLSNIMVEDVQGTLPFTNLKVSTQ